jgi:predicted transcriptional regulator
MRLNRLAEEMRQADVTQDDLAKVLGVARATVSSYICCHTEPSIYDAERIRDAIGSQTPLVQLFERSD